MPCSPNNTCSSSERGAALIFVLVCLLAVAGLVLAGAKAAFKGVTETRMLEAEYQADLLADSLLDAAREYMLLDEKEHSDTLQEPWAQPLEGPNFRIIIEPCNARLNLGGLLTSNRTQDALEELIDRLESPDQDMAVLLDFMDMDSQERVAGSEGPLYHQTDQSTRRIVLTGPLNHALEAPEQLFLVPGWEKSDPDWVAQSFTLWDDPEKININFANQDVFEAFLPELAVYWSDIKAWREKNGFTSVDQLRKAVTALENDDELYNEMIRYISVSSSFFRVTVEVIQPLVYIQRRYILSRGSNDTKARVERSDTLIILPVRGQAARNAGQ